MERSAKRLEDAQRTMAEIEEIGDGITRELGDNREKIISAQQRVWHHIHKEIVMNNYVPAQTTELSGHLDSAGKIVNSMTAREKRCGMM